MSAIKVLDESDEVLRAELARLENQRRQMTARLDERISQLRSIIDGKGTLPLFKPVAPDPPPASMTRAPEAPIDGVRPRGERQIKIYEHILSHPNAGYREIVEAAYGEYTELNYNSTRNAIAALKRNGWLSGEKGAWVVGQGGAAA